jgi:predicted RNase H-like HicB family nuclease
MKQTDNKMKIYNYTVIFKPLEEGGYDIIVPAIPEICTFGDTIEEAREMAEDAIKCYIESALELNEPIPIDSEVSFEKIAVKVAS